jgi:hypothetical protein
MVRDGTGGVVKEAGLVGVCRSVGLVRHCAEVLRRPFGYRHGRLGRAGEIIYEVLNRRLREGNLHHAQSCVSILAYGARLESVSQKKQS